MISWIFHIATKRVDIRIRAVSKIWLFMSCMFLSSSTTSNPERADKVLNLSPDVKLAAVHYSQGLLNQSLFSKSLLSNSIHVTSKNDSSSESATPTYSSDNHSKLHSDYLNSSKSTKAEYEFSSTVLNNEFIVSFNSFYNGTIRHGLLKKCLEDFHDKEWSITDRENDYAMLSSDFDVIKISEHYRIRIIEKLENYPSIKYVYPHKRIFRTLKYVESEGDETAEEEVPDNPLEQPCDGEAPCDARAEHSNPLPNKRSLSFGTAFWLSPVRQTGRKLLRSNPSSSQITSVLGAETLWDKGYTGKGVKVAIFDTGLTSNHPHFSEEKVIDRTDWTNERTLEDGLGHGTFVTGVIASSKDCLGFAPDVDLYIFKVFTSRQVSYTSWFLDAFNYAIMKRINVLNLSIGGPDFMDRPFVDKVWELTANNIIMISAIGNDGPLYGTLNNPADQMDVIGVGGIDFDNKLAKFSSRGMTAWELPGGYGRVKPDIVTYGSSVRGSDLHGGCKVLSGTSVASPVVTGAVSLLLSTVPAEKSQFVNPASVKQALLASAHRLPDVNIFEQGAGRLDLLGAYEELRSYVPKVTFYPSYIDFTDCPYMWPYCSQFLYYGGMPAVFNITIINGMNLFGTVKEKILWQPVMSENGHRIDVSVKTPSTIWPWFGYMAVSVSVSEQGKNWEGTASGQIVLTVESPPQQGEPEPMLFTAIFPIKVKIIPTPPRNRRILWDQFHNLRYPPGYFPRDSLSVKTDPLDWNNDHIHTNFRDTYHHLRSSGYFIEVLGAPFACFDAKQYGALIIVDPEEEYFPEDVAKLKRDIEEEGMSLLVFADWYNTTVMKKIKFYDENTKQWWTPATGGANIPAINDLLEPWGIAFGDVVYDGEFKIGHHDMYYSSGSGIVRFPGDGLLIAAEKFKDESHEIESGAKVFHHNVPVLGLYQVMRSSKSDESSDEDSSKLEIIESLKIENVTRLGRNASLEEGIKKQIISKQIEGVKSGRVVVYGDSNCIDGSHMQKECFWMLDALLEYAMMSSVPPVFESQRSNLKLNATYLPERMDGNNLYKFSKVLKSSGMSACLHLSWMSPNPINTSTPLDELKQNPPSDESHGGFLVHMHRAVAMDNRVVENREVEHLEEKFILFGSGDVQFMFILSIFGVLAVMMVFYRKFRHICFRKSRTKRRQLMSSSVF